MIPSGDVSPAEEEASFSTNLGDSEKKSSAINVKEKGKLSTSIVKCVQEKATC